MSLINAVPKGWLSFFGQKEQGNNPKEFENNIRASVSMNAYYQMDNEELQFIRASLAAGNYLLAGIQVPQGEIWAVHHAAIDLLSAANSFGAVQLGVVPIEFGVSLPNAFMPIGPLVATSQTTGAIGASFAGSYFINFQNPLFLTSASQLTGTLQVLGAGAVDYNLQIRFRRMKV